MIHLTSGAHDRRRDGMCAMEAAAYVAGERHTDHPACVSPVIGAFLRRWNDALPTDAERDRLLKPLLPVILHTNTGPKDDETRAWLATDWLVRVHAATWLDRAGLRDHAAKLRSLAPLTTSEIAIAVQSVINAAGAAAWDAAGAAARAAAGDTLRSTVETLQVSAQDLVRRMAAVGEMNERRMIAGRLREVCEGCA